MLSWMSKSSRSNVARCLVVLSACLGVAGIASAAPLADTVADYSTAAQGTNGFEYGAYTTVSSTGTFSTAGFTVVGSAWDGNEGLGTPSVTQSAQHPGFSSLRPAVRRYTVGSNGEDAYTGIVQIQGNFTDLDGGLTNGFITVDGINLFYAPVVATLPFNIFALVAPGSTIDFGLDASTDGGLFDAGGLAATITPVPEPSAAAALGVALWPLLRRRARRH
jgi:hypothetical protein